MDEKCPTAACFGRKLATLNLFYSHPRVFVGIVFSGGGVCTKGKITAGGPARETCFFSHPKQRYIKLSPEGENRSSSAIFLDLEAPRDGGANVLLVTVACLRLRIVSVLFFRDCEGQGTSLDVRTYMGA